MANFIQGNFVNPVTPEDNNIQIKDRFGRIRYTLAPLQVTVVFVSANLLKVKKKGSDDIINLDFRTTDEAKRALPELQAQIDIGRTAAPLRMDPATQNYIDSKILELSSKMHSNASFTNESYTFTHNLGYKPNVTVTDSNFEEVDVLIKYIGNDKIEILSNVVFTGWVFCS